MQRTLWSILFGFALLALACPALAGQPEDAHPKAEAAEAHPAPAGDAHEGEAHGDAHGDAHHAHVGEEGVSTDPAKPRTDLAIYSFVVFVILFAGLTTFAWKPIVNGLEKREHDLRADIEGAKANRIASEQLLAEHQKKLDKVQDEVREIIAEARRDAEHVKETIVSAANKEAEASRNRAIADIEQARDHALDQLFDKMAESVTMATRQVIGRSLTGEDHDRLVRESLSNLTKNVN
jgi:F-type H+-transporting ATPase subunit b